MKLSGSDRAYKLHQWANDWISIDEMVDPHQPYVEKGPRAGKLKHGIVNPSRCLFSGEEISQLAEDEKKAHEAFAKDEVHHAGLFWKNYQLQTSGNWAVLLQKAT